MKTPHCDCGHTKAAHNATLALWGGGHVERTCNKMTCDCRGYKLNHAIYDSMQAGSTVEEARAKFAPYLVS